MKQPPTDHSARLVFWTREHWSAVHGFVLGMVRKEDVADDLVQEVFRRALESADCYTEMAQARSYLLKITNRLVIDHVRQAQHEITVDESNWTRFSENQIDNDPVN